MAYRQLGALTFMVLGLVAVGCGGDTASAVGASSAGDRSPSNAEQPRNSAVDEAPASPYQPPANPDAPPGSSDASGGPGQLGDLCEELCSSLATGFEQCELKKSFSGMGQPCSEQVRCQIPANLPCETEITSLFKCLVDNLALACAPNADSAGSTCEVEAETVATCSKAVQETTTPANCTKAGDCKCADACTKCTCKAGDNLGDLQACIRGACATP